MEKEVIKTLRISEKDHMKAKLRSVIQKKTLKVYIEELIQKDYNDAIK
ncbi:hypothetical protein LCGC14_2741710 [marine sediment metagenome]|uniref:Uncharacterized protein n=1 Tax=marine sediment metagenome TaxID=412755 RepID=A0A0F8ZRG4_9ZZZZ